MRKKTPTTISNEMRPEYDLAAMKGGVRGKYAGRMRESQVEAAIARGSQLSADLHIVIRNA